MKRRVFLILAVLGTYALSLSCSGSNSDPPPATAGPNVGLPSSFTLPADDGQWVPSRLHVARMPSDVGTIEIKGIGEFEFDSTQIRSVRDDIFAPGHFSVFDVLVYLADEGDIDLEYHYDGMMDTHIIETINGERHWWYEVRYSSGWYENNVFRMDMYPYKDDTDIRVFQKDEEDIARICRTFGDEVRRLQDNSGDVIIPRVVIDGINTNLEFRNVAVTAHDVRSDILKPGVITALDVLLSLGERGDLSALKLTWYERIASADPVDSYWVEQIDTDIARGGCGYVYETGPDEFSGFGGSHIHIPLDVRVIVSPEYALWFWICL